MWNHSGPEPMVEIHRGAVGRDNPGAHRRPPFQTLSPPGAAGRALDHRGVDHVHVLVAVGNCCRPSRRPSGRGSCMTSRQAHQAVGVGILLTVGLAVALVSLRLGFAPTRRLIRFAALVDLLVHRARAPSPSVSASRGSVPALKLRDVPQAMARRPLSRVPSPSESALRGVGAGRLLSRALERPSPSGSSGPPVGAVAVGVLLAGGSCRRGTR